MLANFSGFSSYDPDVLAGLLVLIYTALDLVLQRGKPHYCILSGHKSGYAVASAVILSIIGLLDYGVWLAVNFLLGNSTFPPDRVSSASTLVMQIDSFLAAGYIVAIFQLQADMAKRIEAGTRIAKALGNSVKDEDLPQLLRKKGGIRYFATKRFPLAMLPLGLFVLSGIFAIDGVLYGTRDYLALSISALVWGGGFMILRWYTVVSHSEEVAEFIGRNFPQA